MLRRHQHDRQHFVHTADTAGVDLADIDRTGLEQLLEDHPVLDDLPRGDPDGRDRLSDPRVTQHVVGAGRLLDPQRVELGEDAHRGDSLLHPPDLVRVHHQAAVGAERLADQGGTAGIRLEILADLHLHVAEPAGDRLAHESRHLFVVVAQPAGRGRVGRVSDLEELQLPFLAAGDPGAKEIDCLLRTEDVVDVPEIDRGHELLRTKVQEEAPERHPAALGPEVPDGVHDCTDGHVHGALLRPDPAKLPVRDERAPEGSQVAGDALQAAADDERLECPDAGDADLVAAAARKGEPVAGEPLAGVGVQNHVCGGVVRARVHRVRAVERPGRREPHIERGQTGDLHEHFPAMV